MRTEPELIGACLAMIGGRASLSAAERTLARAARAEALEARDGGRIRDAIGRGADPLGDALQSIRSAAERRGCGAVYTPRAIVRSMTGWLASQACPARIIDPGAGSGRFILAAGEAFPDAELVAVEIDPLSALVLRANVSVRGWGARTRVLVEDYRAIALPPCTGPTAFIGNPPYVRHHGISARWKAWYASSFARLGIEASALAGLHLHFFLKTRLLARRGDVGAFITAAEWLDVNYGAALRQLLLQHLGVLALHVLAPSVEAFPGTATTAVITCFRVGETTGPLRVRSALRLHGRNALARGAPVAHALLRSAPRWSVLVRPRPRPIAGAIELGELFRVHRGQATGANDIWIAGAHADGLPDRVKLPAVTRARELLQAGSRLSSVALLRRVIDLPCDLEDFTAEERRSVDAFLSWAKRHGAHRGYIARHRKAWWSVGLKAPAPILCTYMARRPPQFTLNACGARHLNIAHGLYPREYLPAATLRLLLAWLNRHVDVAGGRTYAGGLTKFEPKEVERLRIPEPASLGADSVV